MGFYTESNNKQSILITNGIITNDISAYRNKATAKVNNNRIDDGDFFYSILEPAWQNFVYLVENDPESLDKNTKFNQANIIRFMNFQATDYHENKIVFLSNLLRVLYEYYFFTGDTALRSHNFISDDILLKLDEKYGEGSNAPYAQFRWIRDTLPIVLMKWLLNSDSFVSVQKFISDLDSAKENILHELSQNSGFAIKDIKSETDTCISLLSKNFDDIKSKIADGKQEANITLEYIKSALEEIKALEERVSSLKSEYNFVGLSHGFSTIKEKKETELSTTEINYKNLFGAIFIAPVIAVILHFSLPSLYPKDYSALFIILPFITIEMAIIYFFRLSYLEAKALRTQLMQIELRLSLCSFIDGYVEYRKKNNIAIDKVLDAFDSLIFSPIQTNENNIPAMFDGLEAIAGVAEKVMKK
ncbi:hypothetical protein [Citrobacter braakii]|uniref:hypothetical protein n=1 Tax=Citrobacter braakii TaxID=57706 RepID=UPI000541D8A4|nr:hypothetical protein [Citrobacter braakii]KHE07233.1 hypothetical protein IB70_00900 [Citrobacter braakii]